MRLFKGVLLLMIFTLAVLLYAGAALAATDNIVDSKPGVENEKSLHYCYRVYSSFLKNSNKLLPGFFTIC